MISVGFEGENITDMLEEKGDADDILLKDDWLECDAIEMKDEDIRFGDNTFEFDCVFDTLEEEE